VVCLPLAMGDRRLGVLRLTGYAAERLTGEREMHHLRAVAGLIAQALERDRLAAEALEADVLRRADQVKTALLASVSHDLRTPLASIKASVTSLLDEAIMWPSDVRQELLQAVDEETDRLTRFVTQLLDLSRLESGAVQPRKDWLSIEEVLVGVGDRLDPGGTRVRVCAPHALPLVRLDYAMVEQIISNLVDNALRYSPDEAPVDVHADTRDGRLIIDVTDVGPGVAPSERERVFDRFYRSAAGSARAPGTGLGLAIARGFSQAQGGDVEYAPNPGGGSIFRTILPLNDDAPESHRP
jgi:two-component system sensor histidine kinase KdpD